MMTKPLDLEEKRRRAILTRMARAGRLGDYLSTLNKVQQDEAYAVLDRLEAAYQKRQPK